MKILLNMNLIDIDDVWFKNVATENILSPTVMTGPATTRDGIKAMAIPASVLNMLKFELFIIISYSNNLFLEKRERVLFLKLILINFESKRMND